MGTRSQTTEVLETRNKPSKDDLPVSGKEVKVFRSVDEIGRDAIDSISDDFFFTYEWFRTLETQRSFDVSPMYICVYEKGKLIAVAPCFIDLQDHFFIDGPRSTPVIKKLVNLGHRFGFCQKHLLLCYSPFCLRSKVLFKKSSEKEALLSLLSSKIDEICRKQKFLFSSFLFVSEFDRALMGNLQSLGYLKSLGTKTLYLDVNWSSFGDYLKSLKHKTRLTIRREIRKCAENGVTIEKREIKGLSVKLSELLSNHILKYSKNAINIFTPIFFEKLNQHARDKIKVFIAKKNNELVGFSLFTQHEETLDAWMCGFNYDALTNTDFAYFNLGYYAPIQWAIDEGIKKIYYRRKSEKIKLDRGCKSERTYAFVKCHNVMLKFLLKRL
jgi:predicted N-acyltransferase